MDPGVLLGLQMVWYQAATLHALQVRRQMLPEIFSWWCQVSKSCPVWDNDSNLPILLDTLGMG